MGSNEKKGPEELRKHERHFVELGAFAVFSDDDNVIPGQVVDISMGGIAFFYYDGDEWSNESSDVFKLFGEDFYMENVPLELVSDFMIADENHPIYRAMGHKAEGKKIRRRGVKFGKLSNEQKEQLEKFITTNAVVKK